MYVDLASLKHCQKATNENKVVERSMTKMGVGDSIYCILAWSKCYNKTILRHKQPASCYNKTIFRHKPISSVLQQDHVSPQTNQNRVTTRQYYATNQPAPCCIIFQNPIRLWFIVVIINRVSVVSD